MSQQSWYQIGRAAIGAYAHLMLNMDIVQHALLPAGPKIIAANHPTTTDPVLLPLVMGEPMHILITEMCFKMSGVGHFLRRAGHIPVVAGRGRDAFNAAVSLLQEGHNVGIFPEGALSPLEGGMCRTHTGAARLAMTTGAPIIPVGIQLERQRIRFVKTTVDVHTETARWYLHGPYALTMGGALRFEGDVEDHATVQTASERLAQRILQLAGESAQRLNTLRPAAKWQPARLANAS